jgi:HK97 gp10 family phage protein
LEAFAVASEFGAKVSGIPDLRAALAGIVPKLRRQALRNALSAGARVVRDAARAGAPVLRIGSRTPYRTAGTVRKAISVRTSKVARRAGNVGVFVNVRPAKLGQRGGKSKTDPFYWRFLEFGTKKLGASRFLQSATGRLNQALQVFIAKIGPAIEKLNRGKDAQP